VDGPWLSKVKGVLGSVRAGAFDFCMVRFCEAIIASSARGQRQFSRCS